MFFKLEKLKKEKSIFGFKILSSETSTIFSYIFLIFDFLISPFFGTDEQFLIAGSLFKIILYSSVLILIINSYIQKSKNIKNYWFFNFPLFLCIPKLIYRLIGYLFLLSNMII